MASYQQILLQKQKKKQNKNKNKYKILFSENRTLTLLQKEQTTLYKLPLFEHEISE